MARPGGLALEFKFDLMKKAFAHTAQFDALISETLASIACTGSEFVRQGSSISKYSPEGIESKPLRYGENPHQKADWDPLPTQMRAWKVHQGKELSYTNLLDLDAALRIVLEFVEPAAVVIKHTNPCGTATLTTISEAYIRAR